MAYILGRLWKGRPPNVRGIARLWPMIAEIFFAFPANSEYIAMSPLSDYLTGHHSINHRFSYFPWWHTSLEGYGMVDCLMSEQLLDCGRWSTICSWLSELIQNNSRCVLFWITQPVTIPSITASDTFRDGIHPWKVMERLPVKCQRNRSTVADDRGDILGFPANSEYIAMCPLSDYSTCHHSINNRFWYFPQWHTSLQG